VPGLTPHLASVDGSGTEGAIWLDPDSRDKPTITRLQTAYRPDRTATFGGTASSTGSQAWLLTRHLSRVLALGQIPARQHGTEHSIFFLRAALADTGQLVEPLPDFPGLKIIYSLGPESDRNGFETWLGISITDLSGYSGWNLYCTASNILCGDRNYICADGATTGSDVSALIPSNLNTQQRSN
jgi:hypothetical protein